MSTPSTLPRFRRPDPPAPLRAPWGRPEAYSFAVIGVLALLTRFIGLGSIAAKGTPVFDEKHYVPQAWDMVRSTINPLIGGIENNPAYGLVVHPPLGKQIIALGERLFGYTPLGWRFMAALFGCLVVLALMGFVRSLSNSWQIAASAGLLATFDGVLLVTSRYGMLDIFQVLFVLLAAWALVADRQQIHRRLHRAWTEGNLGDSPYGPRLGYRWWRFAAGVCLGLALGVKWSGLYYIVFFGLLSVFGDLALRRRYGATRPVLGALLRDTLPALASLVFLPAALYLWSWRAWFSSETSVYRHAAADGTIASSDHSWLTALPDTAASWLYYHLSVLDFHAQLTSSGGHHHPWDSKPWAWLVSGRPILYYSSTGIECGAGTCRRMVYLFGTPAIWWLTIPVLLWALWSLFVRRDRRFLMPLVAFGAGFIPWLASFDRQMYFFYAAPLVPFSIAMIALTLGQLCGRGGQVNRGILRDLAGGTLHRGTLAVAAYLAAVVAMFLYFSPLFYGYAIPDGYFDSMMWMPSWR
ncbi:dolichyl-phosphate-mannose--protein mannosyltransferase [Corynebacterium mastitidis]